MWQSQSQAPSGQGRGRSAGRNESSRRVHWLRVLPTTRSARAGVAWTFGLPSEAYQPCSQT